MISIDGQSVTKLGESNGIGLYEVEDDVVNGATIYIAKGNTVVGKLKVSGYISDIDFKAI